MRLIVFSLHLCSSIALQVTTPKESNLLGRQVFDTIQDGKIAIIPNFLSAGEIRALRDDAQKLWEDGKFSTDALAAYGSNGKFDPTKDRAVLKLNQWKNRNNGQWETREMMGNRMQKVRAELAYNLDRPRLNEGAATTMYGHGSTEISYTRFGPGAFLKRHIDEHHEELKGRDGWSKPTRRSISWLVYLNDDWNSLRDGGQLRCFERKTPPIGTIGARANGDLQIAWLRATPYDPVERPVYLDARRHDHSDCAMYILGSNGKEDYITKSFEPHPILYMAGAEEATRRLLLTDRNDIASRFHYLEPPKSMILDLLKGDSKYTGTGEAPEADEILEDVNPIGGTLVLFDSVSLPHEVLATRGRERWATSGWFHEDQQPIHA